MRWTLLDAASNLGLRPGPGGTISGVDKAPAAIRAAGLVERLADAGVDIADAGAVQAGAYDIEGWQPGDLPYNFEAVERFTHELAARITGERTLILGGDCSVLLGPLLALSRRGRPGLLHLDAHGDFRHPGNAPHVDALAGEELAVATGRGGHALAELRLLRDEDVGVLGLAEAEDLPFPSVTAAELKLDIEGSVRRALQGIRTDEVWVHLDVDILDPQHLPAVDSPEPGGLDPEQLERLLTTALSDDRVRGLDVCIYDPDLDAPERPGAALIAELLAASLS